MPLGAAVLGFAVVGAARTVDGVSGAALVRFGVRLTLPGR